MIRELKKAIGVTLVETLVAMLILSTSAAGVLGSLSYGFKFILRAGKKIEAMNLARKTLEAYRAVWLADNNDTRLSITQETFPEGAPVIGAGVNSIDTSNAWLAPGYDGTIKIFILPWSEDPNTKQISVKVSWD